MRQQLLSVNVLTTLRDFARWRAWSIKQAELFCHRVQQLSQSIYDFCLADCFRIVARQVACMFQKAKIAVEDLQAGNEQHTAPSARAPAGNALRRGG